jgi:beta-lactam-binding protein with PASTA domain/predicted Ser/Thr protein kinase
MSLGDTAVFNDRYEIQQRLGRGGMADVYLARDRLLERRVAVKVLFPEFATDPSFVARFRREAQAAANLTHPNIVAVYDWGQQSGTYFIVMEYVNGRTLAEVLRAEGKMAPVQAATISSEVAAALGFAHRNGVVHRDVKPGNILVTSSGDVKVADFGIARVANAGTDAGLTQAGSVMGTAAYFSPEQAQGATPDPRSDLYSLGIVMYEMVGGRPPFMGDNPVSIAYKQVHEAPPRLRDLTPDVPVAYEAIVAKLLAKNPAARYAGADDLRLDLTRFRDGQRPEALAQAAAAAGIGGATIGNPPVPTTYGQPTTVVAASPGTQVLPSQPPRGATPPPPPPAYEEPRRTGLLWAAIILALLVLGVGGFLLYRALNKDAKSPTTIVMPELTNKPLDEATKALTDLGFVGKITQTPQVNDAVGENIVFAQDPATGTEVPADGNITLTFNPPKAPFTLGNFVGAQIADVKAALDQAKVPYEITEVESDRPAGEVLSQDPAPGPVPGNTVVKLTVSKGLPKVTIPNVANTSSVAAANQLGGLGLVTKEQSEPNDTVPAGTVIRTDPPAGTEVDKGSTVTLVVSSGAAPVQVPNVVGQTESAARDALQAANLRSQVVRVDVPFGSPQANVVIDQTPGAGEQVAPGSTVTIRIGRPGNPTTTAPPPTTAAITTTVP